VGVGIGNGDGLGDGVSDGVGEACGEGLGLGETFGSGEAGVSETVTVTTKSVFPFEMVIMYASGSLSGTVNDLLKYPELSTTAVSK